MGFYLPHTAPVLQELTQQQTGLGFLSYDTKCAVAREFLENLISKFPRTIDRDILKELPRIIANLEAPFINQRSPVHLAKLARFIYFIRRKLSRNIPLFSFKDHFDVRVFPSSLHFTFGSKPVLSIVTHVYLKDKYEVFDEEQILFIIRKLMPETELVKDSIYTFQPSKNTVKTLCFEINKKSGLAFSSEELKQLKELLKHEIKFSIEQLVPRVFMIRNEEEILKNILTLSREIHFLSDLPQVMILFDQQSSQDVIFTIILIRPLKPDQPSIRECLMKVQSDVEYLPDRCQIVRYLRKKHPIEANVFRMRMTKDPSLLRVDMSLNFYLARQKISRLLMNAVGEFRDYNGGIIIKQRETLISFREAFPEISLKDPDLLENFYYSLSPIEAQATLSLKSLKILFELFLEARNASFTKSSDFFLKFQSRQQQMFILIRTPDEDFKNNLDFLISSFELVQREIAFTISAQNTYFLGYFLVDVDRQTQDQLEQSILCALNDWKGKIESRQILKLGVEYPIVSLDPRVGGDKLSALILKMLFEGLMRVNRKGKLEKGIAQKVTISPDQKTYVFKLRSTFWSDGSQVSADDFEYAWKKILSPAFNTPFAYFFYPIKNAKLAKEGSLAADSIGVKALDPFTLRVELEFPCHYFLELTAQTLYLPVHRLVDQRHPNWPFEDKGAYVCNGAFQLKKNNPNEEYELTRNLFYWDKANIKLDEIIVLKADRHHRYEMFQKDLSHWIGSSLGPWDSSFVPGENGEQIVYLDPIVYWFVFNTKRFPFHNKKIRQSLAWGIDRLKLKESVNVLPIVSPIPPLHSQISPSGSSLCSLEEAQALFKEALEELDMSLQDFPIIPLIYLIGPLRNQVARFIKEQWESIFGIRCSLEPLELKVLFPKMTKGDFEVGGMTWDPWINDPIYTLNAFRDGSEPINFSKWENKNYQEIMCLAEREIDLKKRRSYYLQAEEILLDEMPVIPTFLIQSTAFKKKKFHITSPSSFINFQWGYFTST